MPRKPSVQRYYTHYLTTLANLQRVVQEDQRIKPGDGMRMNRAVHEITSILSMAQLEELVPLKK